MKFYPCVQSWEPQIHREYVVSTRVPIKQLLRHHKFADGIQTLTVENFSSQFKYTWYTPGPVWQVCSAKFKKCKSCTENHTVNRSFHHRSFHRYFFTLILNHEWMQLLHEGLFHFPNPPENCPIIYDPVLQIQWELWESCYFICTTIFVGNSNWAWFWTETISNAKFSDSMKFNFWRLTPYKIWPILIKFCI